MSRQKSWTHEEVEYLRANYETMLSSDMAKELERSHGSVESKLRKLGLLRSPLQRSALLRESCLRSAANGSGSANGNWKGGVSKTHYRYKKRQAEKFPSKIYARNVVQQAIKSGILKRLPCEVCQAEPAEAHHDDYLQPLEVRWLCRRHHRELHQQMAESAKLGANPSI